MPLKSTTCGLPSDPYDTETTPLIAPLAVGANLTEKLHLLLAAKLLVQVLPVIW